MIIVGYTYNADQYCSDCTEGFFQVYAQSRPATTEDVLNYVARRRGINRGEEGSYDSSEFPKVITLQMAEHDQGWGSDMRCAGCGRDIVQLAREL